jgi:hypothetical protein
MSRKNTHSCLVCGYPNLNEPPRGKSGGGSYEICPACGFQFGVDDDDKGIAYSEWRGKWLAEGGKWSSKGIPQPGNWKPAVKRVAAKKKTSGKPPTTKKATKRRPHAAEKPLR